MLNEEDELKVILHAHDTGMTSIMPQWVQNTTEADFLAGECNWLNEWKSDTDFRYRTWKFLNEGLLLAEIETTKLLSALYANYRPRLNASEFVKLKILKEWIKGKKLTAPCCAILQNRRKVEVCAGNHRLNTALRLGVTHIPVLIPKAQLSQFHKLLGDFPNHEQPLIKFVDPDAWWEHLPAPHTDN
jgi:hypothetical protein